MSEQFIGTATMKEDGTLVLDLRAEGPNAVGHGRVTYGTDDPRYQDVVRHLGGIQPGESKPVRPWPEDE